jgi:D-glycero-D-manno-heptose 1,7-bisphosphate phosphatase
MHRAVFLDRDGVINVKAPEGQYITRSEDFHFLPQASEGIALLNQARFLVIVVSNQRGIAKARMTISDLEQIHRRMLDQLALRGASVCAIYYCPHDLDASCACRKPAPGMLLQAALDHQIDLQNSWMVGDSDIDMLAGKNAGCRTARILRPGAEVGIESDRTAQSLIEAVTAIIRAA